MSEEIVQANSPQECMAKWPAVQTIGLSFNWAADRLDITSNVAGDNLFGHTMIVSVLERAVHQLRSQEKSAAKKSPGIYVATGPLPT